jgi:hypothetical protein
MGKVIAEVTVVPLGNVSPLCTITLQKERRVWRVVVSMYGRVKVYGGG